MTGCLDELARELSWSGVRAEFQNRALTRSMFCKPQMTPASTYSLNQTVSALTDALRLLTSRVATLEHSHRLQDDELTRLRHAVPRPSTPASSTKLQALAAPYLYTPPASTPTGSPSAAFAFPRAPPSTGLLPPPSVLPQTPPPVRRASWTNQYAVGTAPTHDLGRAPSLPSLPEVLVHDSNMHTPAQSPVQNHGRRRSRANSEIQQVARMRGVSFSSIAPVIAQAKWMQGHQVRLADFWFPFSLSSLLFTVISIATGFATATATPSPTWSTAAKPDRC